MTAAKNNHGISIRVIHWAMMACTVVIAALLVFSTYESTNVFTTLSRETENYIVRQKASQDLMEASDYLTEMVQRFTLEGDTKYLDEYFEEAFFNKRRESAIVSMSESNSEQSLIQNLQEAMEESQALMYREYYAMRLVIEAKGITDYPETLRAIELKETDAFLSPRDKMDLAQRMVMGSEYYARKEVIRFKLKSNLEVLDDKMNAARLDTSSRMTRQLSMERITVIVLTVVLIFLIMLTARLSTVPLMNASRRIRAKEPLPMTGSKEFRQLAASYNEMYGSIHAAANDGAEPQNPDQQP